MCCIREKGRKRIQKTEDMSVHIIVTGTKPGLEFSVNFFFKLSFIFGIYLSVKASHKQNLQDWILHKNYLIWQFKIILTYKLVKLYPDAVYSVIFGCFWIFHKKTRNGKMGINLEIRSREIYDIPTVVFVLPCLFEIY